MRSVATRVLCVAAVALSVVLEGGAQERPATTAPTDPRIGLKAGFRDAGVAARGLELVVSLPKPEGFFDPKAPSGEPTPPERDPKAPDPDDEDAAKPSATPGRLPSPRSGQP